MSVLSDQDIKKEILNGRIVILPPPPPEAFGPNSVDLRLSCDFWFYNYKSTKNLPVDIQKMSYKEVTQKKRCKEVILEPGQLCLGMTLERVSLPPDIMANIGGKSSIGRMGLTVHITAPFHHAGASNRIMLEIKNEGPLKLKLRDGMQICQLVFERLESPTSIPYSKIGRVIKDQEKSE
ncbi:MAG: dCTP deaminase [Candidatus Anstonellales archaeon]